MQRRSAHRPRGPLASQRRGTLRLALVIGVLVLINLYVFLWRDSTSVPELMEQAAVGGDASTLVPRAGDELAAVEPEDGAEDVAPAEPGRRVDGEVLSGDSMGRILRREGLTPPEADKLIRAISPVMDLRRIQVGQSYRLHFADDGSLLEFEFDVSRIIRIRASRDGTGAITAEKLEAETEVRVMELSGEIRTSLYHTIKDLGESPSLVAFFVDVFAYDLNFYVDTHKGDTFRMLVEKEYLGDEFLRYRRVVGAEYSGRAGTFHAFWWKRPDRDEGTYYNADGRSTEKTLLKSPLKYARVSSRYNPRRMHPVLHRVKGHWGTDYAAATGTPIWAAASGKIIYRGRRGGAGNAVILRHPNGMVTQYFHMSKFAKGQKVGQYVKQKQVIGYVGATGLATGPHLHFGVKVNGRHVDPQKIKMKPGPPVPRKYMAKFREETAEIVERLRNIPVKRLAAIPAEQPQSVLPN